MKTRLPLFFFLPFLCLIGSPTHADTVSKPPYLDPFPEFYIAETSGGLVTDIPGAAITLLHPRHWQVEPPPGYHFLMAPASFPEIFLEHPGSTGSFSGVTVLNGLDPALTWTTGGKPSTYPIWWPYPPYIPVVKKGLITMHSNLTSYPVGTVWVYVSAAAVPDSSSTLILLSTALFALGSLTRYRLVRPPGS